MLFAHVVCLCPPIQNHLAEVDGKEEDAFNLAEAEYLSAELKYSNPYPEGSVPCFSPILSFLLCLKLLLHLLLLLPPLDVVDLSQALEQLRVSVVKFGHKKGLHKRSATVTKKRD
jgi:hypothetical protein